MEKIIEEAINALVEKAKTTPKSEDAMRFSQAAQNLMNTFIGKKYMEKECKV